MKLRKLAITVALATLLLAETSGSSLILAEQLPDQQTITAQGYQDISGHYTTSYVDQTLVLSFAPDAAILTDDSVQDLNVELEQASDVQVLPFSQVQDGLYEVKISKELLLSKPKLSIQLKTGSQKEYIFEDLAYELPSEEVSITELPYTSETVSSTSQVSIHQTTEISQASTSLTETSQTTSLEERTSQEQTGTSQNAAAVKEAAPSTSLKAQEGNGKFDIALTNISKPTDISSVQAAVWSEKNGQDDLKWYPMSVSNASASLTVDIKNHSNQSDNYIVHIYITYKSSPVQGINAGKIAITKPVAKNQLNTTFTARGLQVALTSNQVSDYRHVRFAIWGEKNGQDDLKWYAASSTGTLIVPYKQLAGFDRYQVHTYLEENGSLVGLHATNILLQEPTITTTISKVNDTQYKIEIKTY